MTCRETNYGSNASKRKEPEELTEAQQEDQWQARRSRAYLKRDGALAAIANFENGPNDPLCVEFLAEAHEDHGKWQSEIVRLDYEGRKRGWLQAIDKPWTPKGWTTDRLKTLCVSLVPAGATSVVDLAWSEPVKVSGARAGTVIIDDPHAPDEDLNEKSLIDALIDVKLAKEDPTSRAIAEQTLSDVSLYGVSMHKVTFDKETGETKRERVSPDEIAADILNSGFDEAQNPKDE